MVCQQTISELEGVTTTGISSGLTEACCEETGTIGSEVIEWPVVVDPDPQTYEGD